MGQEVWLSGQPVSHCGHIFIGSPFDFWKILRRNHCDIRGWGAQVSYAPTGLEMLFVDVSSGLKSWAIFRSPYGRSGATQAMAAMPFLAARVSSLAAGPRGCFSPRSHLLTTPVVTFK